MTARSLRLCTVGAAAAQQLFDAEAPAPELRQLSHDVFFLESSLSPSPSPSPSPEGIVLCTNECVYNADTTCDDGGLGAGWAQCAEGTDCADCGPRVIIPDPEPAQPPRPPLMPPPPLPPSPPPSLPQTMVECAEDDLTGCVSVCANSCYLPSQADTSNVSSCAEDLNT